MSVRRFDDCCYTCGHYVGSHVAPGGACDAVGCDCPKARSYEERCPPERTFTEREVREAFADAVREWGMSAEPGIQFAAATLGIDLDAGD